jgi:hypothetical protein
MNDGIRNAILLLKEKGRGIGETCRQIGIVTNSYYKVVREFNEKISGIFDMFIHFDKFTFKVF